jgi:hypothetical protein
VEGSACQLQHVQSLNLENSNWVENKTFSVLFCLKRCKEKAVNSQKMEEKNTYYWLLFLCICHFLMASSVVPFLCFFGVFSLHLFSM